MVWYLQKEPINNPQLTNEITTPDKSPTLHLDGKYSFEVVFDHSASQSFHGQKEKITHLLALPAQMIDSTNKLSTETSERTYSRLSSKPAIVKKNTKSIGSLVGKPSYFSCLAGSESLSSLFDPS